MKKKTVWLSMFRYVVPSDYENWLETMALQGWNIGKIHQFNSIKMNFNRTEPKKYRYVNDLNAFPKKDYKDIYEQFGWEFVGQMASCFVWRQEYTDVRPESFSDTESIMNRNKRVSNAISIVLLLVVLGALISGIAFAATFQSIAMEKIVEYLCEIAALLVIAVYLGWVICKIKRNNNY